MPLLSHERDLYVPTNKSWTGRFCMVAALLARQRAALRGSTCCLPALWMGTSQWGVAHCGLFGNATAFGTVGDSASFSTSPTTRRRRISLGTGTMAHHKRTRPSCRFGGVPTRGPIDGATHRRTGGVRDRGSPAFSEVLFDADTKNGEPARTAAPGDGWSHRMLGGRCAFRLGR